MRKPSFFTCFYYCELGQKSNSYYFKKFGVPKGKSKWVPKVALQFSNMKRPKFN